MCLHPLFDFLFTEHSFTFCQTKLRENYLTTKNIVGRLPGMKREFTTDDGVLVDLSLSQENVKRTTENSFKSCLNLLQLSNDDTLKSRHVLVIGEAGVGKTTFVHHIACRWAKEIDITPPVADKQLAPSSKFQLLFALDCKRLKDDMTLEYTFHLDQI